MLQAAAMYLTTSLSEASRILERDVLDILILAALVTAPRGMTISGLAASLNLPRETCRRRVAGLRAAGWILPDRLELLPIGDNAHRDQIAVCTQMLERQARRLGIVAPTYDPA